MIVKPSFRLCQLRQEEQSKTEKLLMIALRKYKLLSLNMGLEGTLERMIELFDNGAIYITFKIEGIHTKYNLHSYNERFKCYMDRGQFHQE